MSNELNKVDTNGLIGQVKKASSKVKKEIKEAFNPNDISDMKFNGKLFNVKNIQGYSKEIKKLTGNIEKLNKIKANNISVNVSKPQNDNLNQNINKSINPDKNSLSIWEQLKNKIQETKKCINENVSFSFIDQLRQNTNRASAEEELLKNKIKELKAILSTVNNGRGPKFDTNEILKMEAEVEKLQSKLDKLDSKKSGNIFSNMLSSVRKIRPQLNSMSGSTIKIKNQIKQMSTGFKTSLGHVLKYAGALFSLRSIYSVLRNSASAWLSSQNKEAQQTNANINYLTYSLGSIFGPMLQYITNLAYQLLKAIQQVVYAFSGINIFAKATASSMNKTAGSAKKVSNSLSSVHSDISNVSDKDSGGGGSVNPNMDLSKMENTPNAIVEAIKNGDWYSVGATIGNKLNEAIEKIPWDKIQKTAKKIGKGTAEFLNGAIANTDWKQLGNTFAQGLNTVIYVGYNFTTTFNWKQFGTAIGNTINGFFENIDWATIGKKVGEDIKGLFNTITGFFQTFDWSTIIDGLIDFLANIDWSGVAKSMFEALGSACASFVNLGMIIGDYINKAFDGIEQYFQSKIEECGGNVVLGILKGIGDAVLGIGQWIYDNIFKPFIDGFKEAFQIHSPSKIMEEIGKFIIEGLFNGLSNVWDKVSSIFINLVSNVGDKFTEIKTNIENWAENTKEIIKGWAENAKTKASECWTNVSNTVKEKIDITKSNISTGLSNAKATITTWTGNIKTTWGEHWNTMASNVKSGLDTAKNNIDSWKNDIGSKFSALGNNATTWGKDLVSNMASGIKNNMSKVTNAVNSVANKIKSFLHFTEPDVGPLSNFHTYMPDMIDLMVQGIHSNAKKVTKELEDLTGTMSYTINTPNITPLELNSNINTNTMRPRNVMADTLSDLLSDNENNLSITIPLSIYVGKKKLGEILLEDLRDMKRQTGKDIEALVGG